MDGDPWATHRATWDHHRSMQAEPSQARDSPGDSPGGGLTATCLGMQATQTSVGALTRRRTGEQEGNKVLYMTAPGTCAVLRTAISRIQIPTYSVGTKRTRDEGSAGFRTSRSAGCAGACAAAPTAIGRRG